MTRTLLIDADILVYKVAASVEHPIEWEPGFWTLHSDMAEAQPMLDAQVERIQENLGGDRVILALTDQGVNWRKAVLPSYKANRASTRKPLVLLPLRQYVLDTYETFLRPTLEGDDILGILATHSKLVPGEKVIVSLDKDMKTIPGLYSRDGETVVEISEEEADRWHMIQTLSGDATDGYKGCPGIGPDRAPKIIEAMQKLVPYEHVIQRGARKGEVETRYAEEPAGSLWEVVTSHYEAAGLNETEALIQARVARICRASDYDFKNKEVKLWSPTRPVP